MAVICSEKYVDPRRELPHAHELDQPWLDRLGIGHRMQLRYRGLNCDERAFATASWDLVRSYKERNLLQSDKNAEGLIQKMREVIDRTWLKPGEGRAVDFRTTLYVLKEYEKYCAWARQFPDDRTVLDMYLACDVPAGDAGGDPHAGDMHIYLDVREPRVAKIGDMCWMNACLSCDGPPAFELDGTRQKIRELISRYWYRPTRENIQEHLDSFSKSYFQLRYPRHAWYLKFDVAYDLNVTVSSVFGEP